jgi:hypothetical protein
MLTNELKENIKSQIDLIDDDHILNEIKEFVKLETSENWFNALPPKAQEGILAGYDDWKAGRIYSHADTMKELRK